MSPGSLRDLDLGHKIWDRKSRYLGTWASGILNVFVNEIHVICAWGAPRGKPEPATRPQHVLGSGPIGLRD